MSDSLQQRLIVREAARSVIELDNTLTRREAEEFSRVLADAYFIEHPADDETPVDVAWLDSLEPEDTSGCGEWWRWTYGDGQSWACMRVESDLPEQPPFSLSIGEYCVCKNPTRGDVRRLARALKINLGESP